MWKIVLRRTGETLAAGFNDLGEANVWHDAWHDRTVPDDDPDGHYSVDFAKY
jgi:hypothetical protein